MSRIVVVGPSDHLAKIAARCGIRDPERLWAHDDNAALRSKRGNPHVLCEGDEIVVPDAEPTAFEVPAGRRHGFRLHAPPLTLRLRLLDLHGEPRVGEAVEADVEGERHTLHTDDDGVVEIPVRAQTERVLLTYGETEGELVVGGLDPIDTPSGLRMRLAALGYLAGELVDGDPDELAFAIALLQADLGLPIDGRLDDAAREALEAAFGT